MSGTRPSRTEFIRQLARLTSRESPSSDLEACEACAHSVCVLAKDELALTLNVTEYQGRPMVESLGARRGGGLLLLGHLDTVWPLGTLEQFPFSVSDDLASGPGVFDMKAGILMMLHSLSCAENPEEIHLLINSDEEIGSLQSRPLIEDIARRSRAVLVFEPSGPGGTFKTSRKGVSRFDIHVKGKASHAGLEPHSGANSLVSMAQIITELARFENAELGTTVTPTTALAGSAANTVPERATVHVDVRSFELAELQRVDQGLRNIVPPVPGTTIDVSGGLTRPPMPESASQSLYTTLDSIARAVGQTVDRSAVGGVSDGNLTAALGVPTLDGAGAIGKGAHARSEAISVKPTIDRLMLLTQLINHLVETLSK